VISLSLINQPIRSFSTCFSNFEKQYWFQPQRYVDTFGNGVYSPTTYEECYKAQYPEFETLNEVVDFLESRNIFGAVQRMAICTQADGNKVRWTAGVVYTTKGAPPSALTELTSRPKRSRRGGTRWDTTHSALKFDLLCRAGEVVIDA
jgi:hypothetical protein